MSKTMTVSEMRKHWADADTHIHDWMKSLIGVTIVADPEPRPDFAGMGSTAVVDWIVANGDSRSIQLTHGHEASIRGIAYRIADDKGLGAAK